MAELTRVRCVLAVRDLAASVAFYRDALGMEIDFEVPGWAFLSRGTFRVMLGECSDAMPASQLGDHSYFVYVTVEGVDGLYDEHRARKVARTQERQSKRRERRASRARKHGG